MKRLLFTSLLLLMACSHAPSSHELLTAQLAITDATTPSNHLSLHWTPVTLPDAWRTHRPTEGGTGWYRIDLPELPAETTLAVYLPTVNSNAEVFIGDTWIGSGGAFSPPEAHNWNRPQFFPFSSDLLATSEGVLNIRLLTYAHGFGELGPVWVGPATALRPVWENHLSVTATLAEHISVIGACIVLALLLLWRTTHDPLYGWGMAATTAFTLSNLNYHLITYPVSHTTWEVLAHLLVDITIVCLHVFTHRLIGVQFPRRERLLWTWIVFSSITLQIVSPEHFYVVAHSSHGIGLIASVVNVVTLYQHRNQLSFTFRSFVLISATAAVLLGSADMVHQLFPAISISISIRTLPLLLGTWCLALWFILSTRMLQMFNASQRSARELASLLHQREAELAIEHKRNLALSRRQTLDDERARLVRDLHDGIGGELILCLSQVEAGEGSSALLARSIRQCLDDLRVILDSLDPSIDSLALALGSIRERITPRLMAAGVSLTWTVDPRIDPPMSPNQVLQVVRWIQEAITNALKHAHTNVIGLCLSEVTGFGDRRGLYIEISDGGAGFDPRLGGRGRGLVGMHTRAAALGGEFVLDHAQEGRVGLWFPRSSLRNADQSALNGLKDR